MRGVLLLLLLAAGCLLPCATAGHAFASSAELRTAVRLWLSNEAAARTTYGEIGGWDTSRVTDMSKLFLKDNSWQALEGASTFNADISQWNTSQVTDMSYMFDGATAFNGDISQQMEHLASDQNDDTEAKARAWERVFEAFRQEHGREPTVWLDEIVIDQSSLDDEAMMCLPANIMSCNKVMVLCGDTYIDRLWCIWELYTLFALFENEQDSFSRLLVVDITTGGPDIATRLQRFDVKNAHCYGPNGEFKIRQAIEAGPGGAEAFNRIMRKLGDQLADQKDLAHQDLSEGLVGSNRRASAAFASPLKEEAKQGGTTNPLFDHPVA